MHYLYSTVLLLFSFISITLSQSDQPDRGFLSTTSTSPVVKNKRVALLIGNGNYSGHANLGTNPKNDAQDLSKILDELGFDTYIETDLRKTSMEGAIRNFQKESKSAEVALFFYAGHGMQSQNQNYLIPVEADIQEEEDIQWECISLASIQDQMENQTHKKLNIIILDACRNNPYRSWVRGGESGLAKGEPATGTIIAFSTSPGSVSMNSGDNGRNGLYTSELIKQLQLSQRITDVFMNTRNEVFRKSNHKQRPWEDSSLTAPFYLNGDELPTANTVNLMIESTIDLKVQVNGEETYDIKKATRVNKIPVTLGYNLLSYLDPSTGKILYEEKKTLARAGNHSHELPTKLYEPTPKTPTKLEDQPKAKPKTKTSSTHGLSREASAAMKTIKRIWPDHISATEPYILQNQSITFDESDRCACTLTIKEYFEKVNSSKQRTIVYDVDLAEININTKSKAKDAVLKISMSRGANAYVKVYVDNQLKKDLKSSVIEFASSDHMDKELLDAFTELSNYCASRN